MHIPPIMVVEVAEPQGVRVKDVREVTDGEIADFEVLISPYSEGKTIEKRKKYHPWWPKLAESANRPLQSFDRPSAPLSTRPPVHHHPRGRRDKEGQRTRSLHRRFYRLLTLVAGDGFSTILLAKELVRVVGESPAWPNNEGLTLPHHHRRQPGGTPTCRTGVEPPF